MRVVGKTSGNTTDDLTDLLRKRENQMLIRRILFTSILALTFIVTLFALVGFLSPAIITIPISGLGLYIVHARHQISAVNEEIANASNLEKQIDSSTSKYSELIARSKRVARSKDEFADEHWTPLAERVARSESEVHGITVIPKGSPHKTWDPISVPPPTYTQTSKAAPQRSNQGEEFSHEDLERLSRPDSDQIFDQQAADIVEEHIRTDRAANE